MNTRTLSIGKLRHLQQCTAARGTFTCLALDHRQNLRKSNPAFVQDTELSRFKLEVTRHLGELATAVLLDPEVSAAQAVAAGILPGRVGLVVAVESTGYGGSPTARQSQVLPGWSVEKAKRMGASMVKLLVYYHPDSPLAAEIEAFVQRMALECSHHEIGLMLEPLSYSLDENASLGGAEKRRVVLESARRLVVPGVDVLKAEFPLDISAETNVRTWEEACKEISNACPVPWIVLSGAVGFEIYLRQVEIACRAGASGCAVGRAVWKEAVLLPADKRGEFLRSTGRERLSRLVATCSGLGRPVSEFFRVEAPFDWYKTY